MTYLKLEETIRKRKNVYSLYSVGLGLRTEISQNCLGDRGKLVKASDVVLFWVDQN